MMIWNYQKMKWGSKMPTEIKKMLKEIGLFVKEYEDDLKIELNDGSIWESWKNLKDWLEKKGE